MKKVVINDQTYIIPEITFEQICRLEENGVYLLNMNRKDRNVASMHCGMDHGRRTRSSQCSYPGTHRERWADRRDPCRCQGGYG